MDIEPEQLYKIEITVDQDECDISLYGWSLEPVLQQLTEDDDSFIWLPTQTGAFGIDTGKISRINITKESRETAEG